MLLQDVCVGCIKVTARLQTVFVLWKMSANITLDLASSTTLLTLRLAPMCVPLILVAESPMTGVAHHVFLPSTQMFCQLNLTAEAEQARQTHKLVTDGVVVFKVVLETIFIFERAQAQIARDFMAHGVVDVILQAVAVFENPLAQITVIRVITGRYLDVAEDGRFAVELVRAHTAPVLMRVVGYGTAGLGRAGSLSLLWAGANEGLAVFVANHERRQLWTLRASIGTLDLLPRHVAVCHLVSERVVIARCLLGQRRRRFVVVGE
jgi:hypothetical protein